MLCAKHSLNCNERVAQCLFKAFGPPLRIIRRYGFKYRLHFARFGVAAAAIAFSVTTLRQERNAKLVEIGVAILRADPQKEPSAATARGWALDLIDANAGGVRFSPEARADLLGQALPWGATYTGGGVEPVYGGGVDQVIDPAR
jgi:hypothetical protein